MSCYLILRKCKNLQLPAKKQVFKRFGLTTRDPFILISILVAMIQVTSFVKLRHRLNVRVAPVGVAGRAGNRGASGINMLYKRAMRNSALVGISFMVGWLPFCIMMLLYDWGHIDQDILINVGWLLVPLTMIQGLANAVIFRARNIYMFFQKNFQQGSSSVGGDFKATRGGVRNRYYPTLQ